MSKRRDRYIIIYQILSELCKKEMTKTELAERLNLLYYSVARYVDVLEKKGLITSSDGKHYTLTEKGKQKLEEIEPLVATLMIEKEIAKKLEL